jgi:hypothetical protein
MKKLALLFVCLANAASPASADAAWVQSTATGYEARLVTEATVCPALHTPAGDMPMTERAAPSDKFLRLCSAPLAMGMQGASVGGMPLPVPVAAPQRILVLGDTGCRIKGATLQACNDPAKWPFPQLAAAAASLKPDLIIHVGDYLYRESPCPAGAAGCAGSPWGDNWTTWQADFFSPAAPLMAAAPMVFARGNHEDCSRAGAGWLRLLGPLAFDAAVPCAVHLPLYSIDLGAMRLAVMDDATASDTEVTRADLPADTTEIAGLAALPAPVWFLHHRPIWGALAGPLDIPIGGNQTLIAAASQAGLIPRTVALQLSGHIHTFEAINYRVLNGAGHVPPQIVAGNGGDNLDVTPRNLRGAVFQGNSHVQVADGLSVGGFGFLLMTRIKTGWNIQLYDSDGKPTRRCGFNTAHDRLDCRA